jgi:hypothetical protein
MNNDVQHIQILSILYYVFAGLNALFVCIPIVYVVFGLALASADFGPKAQPPPRFLGDLLVVMGTFLIAIQLAFTAGYALTGYLLSVHRQRIFCIVMAAITCLSVPLGTILGVFTIIVLVRPNVRVLFGEE